MKPNINFIIFVVLLAFGSSFAVKSRIKVNVYYFDAASRIAEAIKSGKVDFEDAGLSDYDFSRFEREILEKSDDLGSVSGKALIDLVNKKLREANIALLTAKTQVCNVLFHLHELEVWHSADPVIKSVKESIKWFETDKSKCDIQLISSYVDDYIEYSAKLNVQRNNKIQEIYQIMSNYSIDDEFNSPPIDKLENCIPKGIRPKNDIIKDLLAHKAAVKDAGDLSIEEWNIIVVGILQKHGELADMEKVHYVEPLLGSNQNEEEGKQGEEEEEHQLAVPSAEVKHRIEEDDQDKKLFNGIFLPFYPNNNNLAASSAPGINEEEGEDQEEDQEADSSAENKHGEEEEDQEPDIQVKQVTQVIEEEQNPNEEEQEEQEQYDQDKHLCDEALLPSNQSYNNLAACSSPGEKDQEKQAIQVMQVKQVKQVIEEEEPDIQVKQVTQVIEEEQIEQVKQVIEEEEPVMQFEQVIEEEQDQDEEDQEQEGNQDDQDKHLCDEALLLSNQSYNNLAARSAPGEKDQEKQAIQVMQVMQVKQVIEEEEEEEEEDIQIIQDQVPVVFQSSNLSDKSDNAVYAHLNNWKWVYVIVSALLIAVAAIVLFLNSRVGASSTDL